MNRNDPASQMYEKVVIVPVLVSLVGVAMSVVAAAVHVAGLLDHRAADRRGNLRPNPGSGEGGAGGRGTLPLGPQ